MLGIEGARGTGGLRFGTGARAQVVALDDAKPAK